MSFTYDRLGATYATTRRTDPRIDAAIRQALGGARSVVSVGGGTGSYEPPNTVLTVEPSMVMIAQRPPGSAPAVRATADSIPLPDQSVDMALCVLTIHHWSRLTTGIAEIQRVARGAVILTWDPLVFRNFWLVREYLPEIAVADEQVAVPIPALCHALGGAEVVPVPVPWDCRDGFLGAFWGRPEAYLDPAVRSGASAFSAIPAAARARGIAALSQDLESGAWDRRHGSLRTMHELDLGYRLVVARWDADHAAERAI